MRARNIKPGFYKNEQLAECSFEARLLFPGLWMMADREGRLENRPKKIKAEVFPFDSVDVKSLLDELCVNDLILCYEIEGCKFIQVANFLKHQMPHHKEANSIIPAPTGFKQQTRYQYDVSEELRHNIFERDENKCLKCGSVEDLSIDHIIPLSKGGDNSTENLQTLCKRCNSSKGGSIKDYRKVNVEPTLGQRKGNVDDSCRTDILNPESLILNPEESPNGDLSPEVGDGNAQGKIAVDDDGKEKKTIPPCPHKEIISAYHDALPECPQVRVWDETSKLNMQARWKEDVSRRDISWWIGKFHEVKKSDFLMGRSNGSGGMPFVFSLGWFVKPSNFAKVLNGNYVNRGPGKPIITKSGKHSGFESKNYGESGLI